MNKMQQQQSTPLNLVSTDQIQKYLDENKNLIMAILESQKMGKVAECAQYQAILQKNLMYLAAIADAQPPGSSTPSQIPTSSVAPQGDSHMQQTHASTVQQQPSGPVAKLPFQLNAPRPQDQQNQPFQLNAPRPQDQQNQPFQLNALRPQDQQNQLLQFQQQQQLQGQYNFGGGANNGLQMLMHPGHGNLGNMMDLRGNPTGTLEASGNGQGNLALGRDGRE